MLNRLFAGTLAATLALSIPAMAAGDWKKLIAPTDLVALQGTDDPLVIDIRPAADKKGGPSYALGHIPGAVSAPYKRWRGPKENPGRPLDDAALTELLQSVGVTPHRPTVVVHQGKDGSDFGAAARVYWTLKSSGVSQIAILNGGVSAWQAAKLPLTTQPTEPERSTMTASLSGEWMATRADIEAAIDGASDVTLLDARPLRQHLGLAKHKAAKAPGTLPGARRFSQAEWFDPNSPMMSEPPAAQAIAQAADLGEGPVVSFCNTGHWAATNWFALSELAGREDVKMYPGSMVDWSSAGGALESAVGK